MSEPSAFPQDEADRLSELESLKAELQSKRAEYESLGQKEKDEVTKLRDLEQQVALSGQLLLKIRKEFARLSSSIAAQKVELQDAEIQQADRCVILYQRMRYIYKIGNNQAWLEIISAHDPTEALVAVKNMKALVQYDRHLLTSYRDLSASITSGIKRLESDVHFLQALQVVQEGELKQRENTLLARKKLVEKLKKDKNQVEKSIARLEEDAGRISGILEDLRADGRNEGADLNLGGLTQSKGKLVWPTQGKILRQFGTSQDRRGIRLTNPGIDIRSKIGSDVLAAAEGIVIYVSWLRGYGQFLILDHGHGYYTLYANLSDVLVETGERVQAAELIALVGDSGSLEGPKLHFEIRYGKEQLNPAEWLR
jgi:septal ring factor EnvC (AmiA/AmiB activator)